MKIDLGAGQKRPHPDIYGQATFDPLNDPSRDDRLILIDLLKCGPDFHPFRLLPRHHDMAILIFCALQKDVHFVSQLDRQVAGIIAEFVQRDSSFRLEPYIYNHVRVGDLQYRS